MIHWTRDFLHEKLSRYIVVNLKIRFGFLSEEAFLATSLGSQIMAMAIVLLKLPSKRATDKYVLNARMALQ